ncbi:MULTISPECIES: hypothetical protein [Catenuloplanes]|uniref:Microsomal dipeptidase-like Zn-dependent dipeptidase n=1 Tax=Catenuloplanes niger TaxID=587534 RepID=A0AAE3ZQX2_9ACTN|nr:hypothetical protein [Catenuloplanes niger]MDR7322598.1 microsomal dipeptidase-like Zn-dependent dipeptidase [Catenuloplanes niger]
MTENVTGDDPREPHRAAVAIRPVRKETTVSDNAEMIIRFHPVGGEDVSVLTSDFSGPDEAIEAITRALDERRTLVLTRARYDRAADENAVLINLANVVSVRVAGQDSAASGQYL